MGQQPELVRLWADTSCCIWSHCHVTRSNNLWLLLGIEEPDMDISFNSQKQATKLVLSPFVDVKTGLEMFIKLLKNWESNLSLFTEEPMLWTYTFYCLVEIRNGLLGLSKNYVIIPRRAWRKLRINHELGMWWEGKKRVREAYATGRKPRWPCGHVRSHLEACLPY